MRCSTVRWATGYGSGRWEAGFTEILVRRARGEEIAVSCQFSRTLRRHAAHGRDLLLAGLRLPAHLLQPVGGGLALLPQFLHAVGRYVDVRNSQARRRSLCFVLQQEIAFEG